MRIVDINGERDATPEEIADITAAQNGLSWDPFKAPLLQPLDRLTFWLTAAAAGVSKWSVRDRIATMPDGSEKNEAIAFFEDAQVYRRNDPLLISMAAAEGISETELDALWIWALTPSPSPTPNPTP